MKSLAVQIADFLSEQGPLANHLPGYEPRASQQEMAELVSEALASNQDLVIEAPSGSGKTLAYLLPGLLAARPVIISTATRYLQDQLIKQDIPLLLKALGVAPKVCVLKGRSSYLCPYYLDKYIQHGRLRKTQKAQLLLLRQRFTRSASGELDPLMAGLEPSLRKYASCSQQDCLGSQCPAYTTCPLMLARKRAETAQVIVVNHSVLFSELVTRARQDITECPGAAMAATERAIFSDPAAVIIDEAHRLLDFAQVLVGDSVSHFQLLDFCRAAQSALETLLPSQKGMYLQVQRIINALSELTDLKLPPQLDVELLSRQVAEQLLAGFERFQPALDGVADGHFSLRELSIRNRQIAGTLHNILHGEGVCWFDAAGTGFHLRSVPVDPAKRVRELKQYHRCSWIFTSATLSVAGQENRFESQLGLPSACFYRINSPFDYQSNARLYHPLIPVMPSSADYLLHVIEHARTIIEAGGRVLFLFSSHRALQEAAVLLRARNVNGLLVHGEADHAVLIKQFKQAPDGVLLGTGSYWEGLDLSGVPLAAVIIDKLPFSPPTDPIVQMRSEQLQQAGFDSFTRYQLPEAVLRLRQGCGRLLRRVSDRGVIMLADPRLRTRSYGAQFIDSLPPMTTLESASQVAQFLQEIHSAP